MKQRSLLLSVFAVLAAPILWGDSVPDTMQCRSKVISGGSGAYEKRTYSYNFIVEVISDTTGKKAESSKWGKPFVAAVPDERYSIRLHNPLPVRAAVNLTVDGLSSVNGTPVSAKDGKKWIIAPNSYITIRGWQVSGSEARRFVFTDKETSYAAWRANAWGKDLSVNCGVIGAAYFWSKQDMEDWFEKHPVVEEVIVADKDMLTKSSKAPSAKAEAATRTAGTGMGEKEDHRVTVVAFNYDMGMYQTREAVIIYYDFPPSPPRPSPFTDGYSPEMPSTPRTK